MLAVEPSDGHFVAQRNLARYGDRVSFLHTRGAELPATPPLDLIVSVGVLQFIPDPKPVVDAAFAALVPGGRFFVWLYAREGTVLYRAALGTLRAIGRTVPHAALAALVRVLDVPLALYMRLCRVLPLPLRDYLVNVLARFTPEKRRLVIYDQLNPTHAHYHSRAEAEELLLASGFTDVRRTPSPRLQLERHRPQTGRMSAAGAGFPHDGLAPGSPPHPRATGRIPVPGGVAAAPAGVDLRAGLRTRASRRPRPDIGCGPGDLLAELPASITYVGFDKSEAYVRAARSRFGDRGTFFCRTVDRTVVDELGAGSFDLVVAHGVLHHLDDAEADAFFALARAALTPVGRLVTADGCWVAGQSPLARYLLARDRGRHVRTESAYRALAERYFPSVVTDIRHDTSRVPYTIVYLVCSGQ